MQKFKSSFILDILRSRSSLSRLYTQLVYLQDFCNSYQISQLDYSFGYPIPTPTMNK